MFKVGVVIPIFNEQGNLPELIDRLLKVLEPLYDFELIFVNDGSNDQSRPLIESVCHQYSNIKLINFSRNFGHQQAISAGLKFSSADVTVVMDGDLQDPPEVLPEFIAKWLEGYEVVYAVRQQRKENFLKKSCYHIFYRILKRVTDIEIPLDSGDFACIDKKVVDHLNALPEKNRFVRGLRSWIGYRQIGLAYSRDARKHGQPKFTTTKLMKLAYDGLISFTHKPVRLVVNLGVLTLLSSVFLGIVLVYLKLTGDINIPGYTSIVLLMLVLGGAQMLSLGILGEYIARILFARDLED